MVVRAAKSEADQASRLTNGPRYCAALNIPQSASRRPRMRPGSRRNEIVVLDAAIFMRS